MMREFLILVNVIRERGTHFKSIRDFILSYPILGTLVKAFPRGVNSFSEPRPL